jgi:hypothetical protein
MSVTNRIINITRAKTIYMNNVIFDFFLCRAELRIDDVRIDCFWDSWALGYIWID